MHPEKYSLAWNNYSDHLRDMMKKMMNDDFTDVTLVSEDRKHIKAHKNILSACSPVFKDIVNLEQSSKPIIYLRGINFSDLESIMQFIYLGEATFHEERMDEFLSVAKSLKIKELCNAEAETNSNDEPSPSDPVNSANNVEEESMRSSHIKNINDKREVIRMNGKYECNQCDKTYNRSSELNRHSKSKHDGVNYACDQNNSQFTDQGSIRNHNKSKHAGVIFACDQCDYQATRPDSFKKHIESIHKA